MKAPTKTPGQLLFERERGNSDCDFHIARSCASGFGRVFEQYAPTWQNLDASKQQEYEARARKAA